MDFRARWIAAWFNSRTRPCNPCFERRAALAPKVFVSMSLAPACTYESWMRETKSGAETFSSSKQTSTGAPDDITSVPIAPQQQRTEEFNSYTKAKKSRRREKNGQLLGVFLLKCFRVDNGHVVDFCQGSLFNDASYQVFQRPA